MLSSTKPKSLESIRIFHDLAPTFRTLNQQWLQPVLLKLYCIQQLLITAAAAKSLQSCPALCDPVDSSPPGSPVLGFSRQEHWSGLHFLLQYIKVKSESEVTQSCPTLSDPMDCSLAKTPHSQWRGPRSQMLQLKDPLATTKTLCGQINK